MKTAFAAACLIVGVAFVPVTSFAADTKTDAKMEKAPATKTEKAKEVVEDSWITTKIKADQAADKKVSAMHVKVETKNGVVTLSGEAKTQAEVDAAVAMAKGTKGVVSVKNDIKVVAAKK